MLFVCLSCILVHCLYTATCGNLIGFSAKATEEYLIDEWCVGPGTKGDFVLDAAIADQPSHLLHPLDDVIVRIFLAGLQALILLHLPEKCMPRATNFPAHSSTVAR